MSRAKSKTARCCACRKRQATSELVRLVADPNGGLVVDLKDQLGGRGAFVCLQRGCLDRLQAADLAHAVGLEGLADHVVAALPQLVGAALAGRIKSLLGMAQKSGRLVSGSDAARAAVRRAPPTGWMALVAEDASPNIARRLCSTLEARGVPWARCLTTAELGQSIGKSPRSIVVIEHTGLARHARQTIGRFEAVLGRGA